MENIIIMEEEDLVKLKQQEIDRLNKSKNKLRYALAFLYSKCNLTEKEDKELIKILNPKLYEKILIQSKDI